MAQSPPPPCGTPGASSTYIDTFNGITAFSNDSTGSVGCYDAASFEWECVEFVHRYYSQRFNLDLGSIPVASQAFAILQSDPRFIAFSQGSTDLPSAEDIIVFGKNATTPYGHVAIAKTDPILQTDGTYQVPIIEQNSYLTHVLVLQGDSVNGFKITGRLGLQNTAPIIGWVRRVSASQHWSHFTLSGGPAVQPQPLAYDPRSDRLIHFGGLSTGPCCTSLNDVWVVVNASGTAPQWQQLQPLGDPNSTPSYPPGRNGQSTVYDQANNLLIVFGGGQFGGSIYNVLFNDVWVLSNANGTAANQPQWTHLNPSGTAPAPREDHQAVYDPSSHRMIIFGGGNNGIMNVPADVWVLTNANGLGGTSQWIQLLPEGGNAPTRRQGFGMGYDPATNRAIVFGGCCSGSPQLGDFWVLKNATNANNTGAAWQGPIAQGAPAPGGRSDFASGYDPGTNRFVLTGGLDLFRAVQNDLWVLGGANATGRPMWVNTIPNDRTGSPPRSNPVGTYDPVHNLFFEFTPTTADLWVLSNANSVTPAGP